MLQSSKLTARLSALQALANKTAAEAQQEGFTSLEIAMALAQLDTREGIGDVQHHLPGFPADDIVYDQLPDGLITLTDAARKYGLNIGTLRTWVLLGYINKAGRLKGPARGGGFLLLSEDEVLARVNTPRRPGRPRKH